MNDEKEGSNIPSVSLLGSYFLLWIVSKLVERCPFHPHPLPIDLYIADCRSVNFNIKEDALDEYLLTFY